MTFSVIIPCYNQAHYLDDSLSSLLSQSYSDWEAIIVNDGSTDNTEEVANKWCNIDHRVNLISISNSGLSSARNKGIEISSGKYIALLDADDKYASNHLEFLLKSFQSGSDLQFSGYSYFSSSTCVNTTVHLDEQINFNQILYRNLVPPVAVSFKKSFLLLSGGFDTSLKSAEDWDLWIRFYKVGAKLSICESPTCFYRISENSMSRQFATMYVALKNVSIQAFSIDNRISENFILNKNIETNIGESIKRHLLLCLGVAIVQNKQSLAIDLFKKEMDTFKFVFKHSDFRLMCSYLSFRYQVSKKDIDWVFETLYPRFYEFIDAINLEGLDKNILINEIFSVYKKKRIKHQWGFLSPLINRFSCI